MQRDAMRPGRPARPEHRGRGGRRQGRDASSRSSARNLQPQGDDHRLPDAPRRQDVLHHSWSGDLLSAAFYYMPKGVKPAVLSFWGPDQNGVVQNDFLCIGRTAKSPVLAHQFLNFFLDEKNAYDNFVNFTGYTPPQKTIDAAALIKQGLIPKTLEQAVVRPGPVRGQSGAAAAERQRRSASGTTPGRSSRRADERSAGPGACWRSPASPGCRSSSWSPSTRSSRSRSATRTRCPSRSPSGSRWTGTSATCSTR